MSKSKRRECIEKCCYKAENCELKEDGTWDCSISAQNCIERCRNVGK